MRQLPHLLQKLVDTFYKKEKTSQQPLMRVLRGACSQFLQEGGAMGAQLSTGVLMGLYYLKLVLQRDERKSAWVTSKALF